MLTRREFLKVTAAGSAFALFGNMKEAKASMSAILPDTDYSAGLVYLSDVYP